MYQTLEELQQNYPIHSIYKICWNDIYEWCPTSADVSIFKQKHPNIRNFHLDDDGMAWCEEKIEYKVDGYLFDGEFWSPAIQTWDGWLPIDREELEND